MTLANLDPKILAIVKQRACAEIQQRARSAGMEDHPVVELLLLGGITCFPEGLAHPSFTGVVQQAVEIGNANTVWAAQDRIEWVATHERILALNPATLSVRMVQYVMAALSHPENAAGATKIRAYVERGEGASPTFQGLPTVKRDADQVTAWIEQAMPIALAAAMVEGVSE